MAISHDTTRAQMPAITGLTGGQDGNSRIFNKMRTWYWRITVRATVAPTGATPGPIINQGRLAALFQFVGINENGTKYQWDARALANMSDKLFAGMPGQQHLVTNVAGSYDLVDQFYIPCAWPLSSRPWETAWREKDPNATTTIFLTPWPFTATGGGGTAVNTGMGSLINGGAGETCPITNLTVNITQVFDQLTNVPPLFRPRFDTIQQVITNTGVDLEQLLPVNGLLRGLVMQSDTNVGEVSDIVTGFQLRTDTEQLEGYGQDVIYQDEILAQPHDFGGSISASELLSAAFAAAAPASYTNAADLFRNYQSTGRLTQCLNLLANSPGFAGPNFRALITGGPSGVSGATSSLVRFNLYKLERIQGVTAAKLPAKFGWG